MVSPPKGVTVKVSDQSIQSDLFLSPPEQPLECGNFIEGQWQQGSGSKIEVISPYFGHEIGSFQATTPGDVEKAVRSAHQAASGWAATPIKERTQVLFRFREILLRDQEKIARVISLELGKVLAEAKAGLMKGVEVLEFA